MVFEGNERKQLEQQMLREGRLPPGQALTLKWPVLHYGSVPRFNPGSWEFRVLGTVETPLRLNWEEFNRLPKTRVTSDFHCVTRWSRFDNHWEGVGFRDLLKQVKLKAGASHALIHAEQGFTANVPLADLDRDNVLLYAWKSVKWVRGIEFLDHDVAGFWEQNGYHMYGDPWKEQRFDTD
jgi:DMSO/TMAO reductase YedYZ molybdopterin-dependent catalytic subunit